MTRMILGLDMGNTSLGAVVVEKQLKGFSIRETLTIAFDGLGTQKDSGYKDSDQGETETTEFERALFILLKKINCKNISSVAVAIPSSSVSFRTITLPFKSSKKIRQVLDFELSSHLPLADTTYVSDFIQQKQVNKQNSTILFTASVPDVTLAACFNPLRAAGLKPSIITAQGYIAADHLFADKNKQDTLWIELGKDHTTFCLGVEGAVVQIRSTIKNPLPEFLSRAIHQTIEGESQRSGRPFKPRECIVVCSHSQEKRSEALLQCLEKDLGCPVVLDNSHEDKSHAHGSHDYDENLDREKMPVNAFSAAMAHVDSRPVLNFCQGVYSEDSMLKRHRANILVLLFFFVMAFFAFMFKLETDILNLEKNHAMLKQANLAVFKKSFPGVEKIVDPLMQMQIELKQLKETSGKGTQGTTQEQKFQATCIDILSELSNKIPQSIDVETTRFILTPGHILLSGSTANFNDIDRIKGILEGSDIFKQVEIQSAAAEKTGNRVKFKFAINL